MSKSDLISRQDAIDAIECICNTPCNEYFVNAINRLPSAQQWIPCSERLPEEKDMVLVTRRNGAVDYMLWNDWWYKQDRYPNLKPIAWMPSPQPWSGEVN